MTSIVRSFILLSLVLLICLYLLLRLSQLQLKYNCIFTIFTQDGISNIQDWMTVPEAHKCWDSGIHLFAVGVGLNDTREVTKMASKPTVENTFFTKTFDGLKSISQRLVATICEGRPIV